MLLIDSHTHVYLPAFDTDRAACLQRAADVGVGACLLPAIDSESHEALLEMVKQFPQCRPMMGLHPCSVKENFEEELTIVERYLAQQPFVAIGEIGLDFYWDKTFVDQQYTAFRHQLQLALQYNLPVSIHSRNATDECLEVVAQYPGLRGVFHCFSGTAAQAAKVMDLGLFLGIGGVATFKNGGLDKVLPAVGLSRVVLETDAPYLAPVPHRGKRNEPAYTALVAERLAVLLDLPLQDVAAITTENAKNLFGL